MRSDGEAEPGIGSAETMTLPDAEAGPARPGAAGLTTGTMVDRFVVLERLGEGGMGVVYSAFDPQLDRKVAIKFLRHEVGTEERLLREAQAMARLSHPNVVQVFDVGSYHGRVFVAMEFVEGSTLKAWLKERPRRWSEMWPVLRDAARGLAAAHAAGIVHRDFKPDNVLVDRAGRARVTDFGLARSAEGTGTGDPSGAAAAAPLGEPLTRTGAVVGTPMYMAPEQHLGEPTDAASDQFAFCVTLYEALYGARPFAGDTVPALAAAVISGELTPPPRDSSVPRWRRDLVLRGLARAPADRFPSIDALTAALDRDPVARRRRLLAAAVAVLLIGGAMTLLWLRAGRGESTVCTGAGERMAAIWNDARRSQLRSAFQAIGRPYAADSADRVITLLDERADDWVAMHTEACAATHVTGQQSDMLLDRRMQCLDRRLEEIDALSRALSTSPDAVAVEQAIATTSALPGLEACADTDMLLSVSPMPDDMVQRQRLLALRSRFLDASNDALAGRRRAALATIEGMYGEVKAAGWSGLDAEVEFRLGDLHDSLGDDAIAEKWWLTSAISAARARAPHLQLRAYRMIAWARSEAHKPGVDEMLHAARAALLAAGDPPARRAEVLMTEAKILADQGEFQKVVPVAAEAYQINRIVLGESDSVTLASAFNLAVAEFRAGDLETAKARLQQQLPIARRALGARHPEYGNYLQQAAVVESALGNYAAGRGYAEDAVRILKDGESDNKTLALAHEQVGNACARLGDHECALAQYQESLRLRRTFDDPSTGMALMGVATELAALKRWDEATAAYRESLQLLEQRVGADHPQYALALFNFADLVAQQGKHAEAIGHMRRALAIYEAKVGHEHPNLGFFLLGIATALSSQDRPDQAVAPAQRGLDIAVKAGAQPLLVSALRAALGMALYDSGRDLRRGRDLVSQARGDLVALGPPGADPLTAVDVWLAKRKLRP